MGQLTTLQIEAYRGLRDLKLDGFGRVNLLVGGNNAGKTSILEAIALVARPFDPAQWIQTVTSREFSGSVIDGLWSLFPGSTAIVQEPGEANSASLSIRAEIGGAARHLSALAQVFVEAWTDVDRGGTDAQLDAELVIDTTVETQGSKKHQYSMEFYSKPKRVLAGSGVPSLRVFVVTPQTHRSTTQLISNLSHAINSGVKPQAIDLLRLFDPAVKDVLISRSLDRDAIRIDHEKKGIVDLSSFGDGMRRAFAMSLALSRASGGLLLVDEIESAIHTRALDSILPWLVRAAKAADVQIVATTHSLEAIDAVLRAFEEDESGITTYYLRLTEQGHVCRRYDLAGLRNLRNEGLDIR